MTLTAALHFRPPTVDRRRVARWVAIVALELLIGIHLVLTPSHLAEMLYIGVLFTIGNVAFFASILLLASSSVAYRLAGWWLGGATCAGEFVGFVLSRTVGLPQGYHETWASAPEDLLGLASMFCEVVFAVAMLVALRTGQLSRAKDSAAPAGDDNSLESASPLS